MESQSQEMLAKFGAAIIAALAFIEKSSSETGSTSQPLGNPPGTFLGIPEDDRFGIVL